MDFKLQSNAKDIAVSNHWRAKRVLTTLRESNKANARLLKKAVREQAGLTDHSLDDLRRMGHPYAKRAPNPPHPPQMIHAQSGGYRRAFFARTSARGNDFFIEFGNTAEPLATWLEYGTKKMIERAPLRYLRMKMAPEMQLNNRRAYRSALGLHGAAARSRARKYMKTLG
ncbi:MAG TPA: hypothetical protein VM223_23830 [Planctomycetota bacterium]|nr:hypothetical protein [Planctomycetota bacterium]